MSFARLPSSTLHQSNCIARQITARLQTACSCAHRRQRRVGWKPDNCLTAYCWTASLVQGLDCWEALPVFHPLRLSSRERHRQHSPGSKHSFSTLLGATSGLQLQGLPDCWTAWTTGQLHNWPTGHSWQPSLLPRHCNFCVWNLRCLRMCDCK